MLKYFKCLASYLSDGSGNRGMTCSLKTSYVRIFHQLDLI